ncbi:MAG: SsrA-binding protein SmpB [bacterium]|nr:SsrA-binding protein SmpB [bacterium]
MDDAGIKVIATNRRAQRDYDIIGTYECGMVLRGSEVKSLRDGTVTIAEAYGKVASGEVWLHSMHVPPRPTVAAAFAPDPDRPRKLLLHRSEISRIKARVEQDRLLLIPLSLYFRDGRAKVEMALARRRRKVDRRTILARREAELEARRAMSQAARTHDRDAR